MRNIYSSDLQKLIYFALEFGKDYVGTNDTKELTDLIIKAVDLWQGSGMSADNWMWVNQWSA